MKLLIKPITGLCDEKTEIKISELPPFSKVEINASMRYPWVKIAPRLLFSMGGTVEGSSNYSADSWQKAIDFFRE
jgi:hypothetical protein